MKYYNVHNVHQNDFEATVNSHIRKGYAFEGWRNAGGPRVQLVFSREFYVATDIDKYAAEQAARRAERAAAKQAQEAAKTASA